MTPWFYFLKLILLVSYDSILAFTLLLWGHCMNKSYEIQSKCEISSHQNDGSVICPDNQLLGIDSVSLTALQNHQEFFSTFFKYRYLPLFKSALYTTLLLLKTFL